MPIQSFEAEVCGHRDLTHDVREIAVRLRDPATIAFKAGQFISFEIQQEGKKFPLTRPYSIASPPSRSDTLDLLLNLVPGGPGSSYLFSLAAGDVTQFKGPAGAFYLHDDHNRDHLFVATATGIAPFRSMLFTLFERGCSSAVTLIWGVRHQRDLYYQDELQALASTHPNFRFIMTLSRPDDGWTGERGRVTRLVEERITSVENLAVYLCGNSGMLKDVTDAVRKKGLCPIYREKFYEDAPAPP
ncbi:MAG TPA: FAD-binding oxidoreductase [Nitrospirales bacterium]|jgi:NAD(P)H-flavin reductase